MKVDIEPSSGFCFGVENAVNVAEEALQEGETVYCLGEIVHNDIEVARLKELGLKTITYEEFEKLRDCKVLIRAHGEPPSTYITAARNNITIIDATCPIVHSLQEKIKRVVLAAEEDRAQIVIFGKEGHAEVIGLIGAAAGKAVLVTGLQDIGRIDYTLPVILFSQTTKSKTEYENIASAIEKKLSELRPSFPGNSLKVYNTICRQVSGREPRLRIFVRQHDVVIFVSGRNSSNGKMLYDVCLSENKRSFFISSVEEINREWFRGVSTAGICGATSTPRWLIREVADAVRDIASVG